MRHKFRRGRLLLPALIGALMLAAVPAPALADDGTQPTPPPRLQVSIAKAAIATAATSAPARVARSQGSQAPDKPSFFRTRAGVAVIGILAAGTAYAVYSARHDRIHSVIRSKQ